MRLRVTPRSAWAVPVACVALLTVGLGLAVAADAERVAEGEVLVNVSLSMGFGIVGALIVSRYPRHPLGLLHLGVALASATTVFAYAYAYFGLVYRPGSLPGALVVGWVSAWIWTLGFSPAATLGLLLFPDGRLPSRRWRWVAALPVAGIAATWLQAAFAPGPLVNHPVEDNPVGIPGAGPASEVLGAAGFPLVVAGLVGGIASLVVRWRRSEPASRQRRQIALLVLAALATLTVAVPPGRTDNLTSIAVGLVVMALIPAAVGVAILRHRLYDIDVAVSRSLVYGGLTAAVLLSYAAAVAVASRAAGDDPSVLPGLVAAAVAVGLLPLRGRLQRGVDRLMYGARGDPYAAVSGLANRLSAVAAPGEASDAIVSTIRDALRVPYVAVEVEGRITVSAGSETNNAALRLPVVHQGVSLGHLIVAAGHGRALDARDRALLAELVRQAGPALLAAKLTDALQESRQRLVTAREEERRRLRRDLHDGLGPTLAAVALGIDVAVGQLDAEPDQALAILKDVKEEANLAVEDIRRIAYGLRPPALDELGLLGALSREADRLRRSRPEMEIRVEGDSRELSGLDAAVEVAAFRIAAEAMTNAARHSRGNDVQVLVRGSRDLEVSVRDDGGGLEPDVPAGVGLTAMRERAAELGGSLQIHTSRNGTTVCARLPGRST